jgi:acetate kinase
MGFTPIAGVPMGTRCGDIEAGIMEYLMKKYDMDINAMMNVLNKKSGVAGISCVSSDFRDLEDASRAGNPIAQLARLTFAYAVKKYIGAYAAAMNGLDAVVFTAGVGENDGLIRNGICVGMEWLGIDFDSEANAKLRGVEAFLTKPESKTKVLLIPTNEELMIAIDTAAIVSAL